MTNELEKTFFDTFGIEPKSLFICKRGYNPEVCTQPICKGCNEAIEYGKYPKITDRILLELICIAHTSPVITFVSRDIKDLKEEVLMVLCHWVNFRDIKHQVRTLFKEVNNDDR